jgi:hypothetical protein
VYTPFNELRERAERMHRLLARENTFRKVANVSEQTSLWANSTGRELLRTCVDEATIRYASFEKGGAQ